jgi:hypothetical protein
LALIIDAVGSDGLWSMGDLVAVIEGCGSPKRSIQLPRFYV